MKRLAIIFALGAQLSAPLAFAEYKTHYDYKTGTNYSTYTDSFGNTHVQAFNKDGKTWRKTIKPDGSQSGFDSNFNYWNYNNSTGDYTNYGTGKTRNTRYGY